MNTSLLNKIKKWTTDENKTMLIGLLSILVFVWLVIYLIPSVFVSLFDTVLGRIILVLLVIVVSLNNYKYGQINFRIYDHNGLSPLHYAIIYGDSNFIMKAFEYHFRPGFVKNFNVAFLTLSYHGYVCHPLRS